MKEIVIKDGKVIIVDDDYYDQAIQYNWHVNRSDKYGHVTTTLNGRVVSFKKLILGICSPKIALFKNDNSLDLRKENIFVFDSRSDFVSAMHKLGKFHTNCSYRFNESISKAAQGQRTFGKKNSKYIGVRLVPTVRMWQAVIRRANQNYFCGSYELEEYAALAYDKKAIELFGLNAKRNFPDLSYEDLDDKLKIIEKDNEAIFRHNLSKRHQGRRFSNTVKKSKYVGVCPNKSSGLKPWRATIFYQNKQYHLGTFDSEEEAAKAYDNKAISLYGEKARLNFPKHRFSHNLST